MQVHGIGSHRLMYNKVVELRSNHKPACADSTGSNRIEKDKVACLLDLFQGTWEGEGRGSVI